jgi:general stress protein 26
MLDREKVVAAAREIIGAQKYCALVTVGVDGRPQVRTMNPFPPEDDLAVWMATDSRCRKVQEIRNNPNVCLYYADHREAKGYVAVSGKAVLVDDAAEKEKRKRDYWEQAFPDWEYLLLIKIIPDQLDVLHYARDMLNAPVGWRTPSIGMGGEAAG